MNRNARILKPDGSSAGEAKLLGELTAVGLYAALLAFAIPYHEPWADEAQAWQLARSLTPWQLFHTYLRYEGSPGLWHLLLWTMIRLHVSYSGMHWWCGLIAIAGIAVLVFRSPFPRSIRLLLPFTFFLAFQFAVIARSYLLVPLLLFSALTIWKRNPLLIALLLGLLANVAAHATVISLGVALMYALDQRREPRWPRKTLLASAAILFAASAFALWTAWPTQDVYVATYHPPTSSGSLPFLILFLVRSISSLCWGFCEPAGLSIIFWVVVATYMYRIQRTAYLIPVLLLTIFSGAVYLNFWHAGLMEMLLLAILWITWDAQKTTHISARNLAALHVSLLFVIVLQIGWSIHAIAYDHTHDYSPDLAAARFLESGVNRGDKIAVTYLRDTGVQAFHSVGIEPYFHQHLYMNEKKPFWWWSRRNTPEASFPTALAQHPAIVLVEYYDHRPFDPVRDLPGAKTSLLTRNGYALARTFCATVPERFGYSEDVCHLIFLDGPAK